jgi:hypothetical protein
MWFHLSNLLSHHAAAQFAGLILDHPELSKTLPLFHFTRRASFELGRAERLD